ncbi:DUF7793 family protein [Arthrobacter sp.]|uniref:DUF7793 family protein n=1 Tax=Arthrobacter sp. TaxID=1667 RepID=UPI002810EAA1|nr:STAS/SEC14 domain-containing protein [Arthrobacter sp.]
MTALWLMPTDVPEDPVSGSLIRLVLPAGEHITRDIAEAFADQARTAAAGVRRPVLLVITGIASLSREARGVLSRSRSASAIAVLGGSAVDRVLANFLLGGEPPPCPIRYFGDEGAAVQWLSGRTHDR